MRELLGKYRGFICAAVLGVAVAACIPTSDSPILVDGQDPADPALIGTWYGALDEDDGPFFIHFFRPESEQDDVPAGGMSAVLVYGGEEADDEGGWASMYALTAEVAGQTYLSMKFQLNNGEETVGAERGWHLFAYEIDNDTFRLRAVDEDRLADLLNAGALQRTATGGNFTSETRITAGSAELVNFLQTPEADDLFTVEQGSFTRVIPGR